MVPLRDANMICGYCFKLFYNLLRIYAVDTNRGTDATEWMSSPLAVVLGSFIKELISDHIFVLLAWQLMSVTAKNRRNCSFMCVKTFC